MFRIISWLIQWAKVFISTLFSVKLLGETVVIPVALIAKKAGDKLIDSLKTPNQAVSTINTVFDFPLVKNSFSLLTSF